MKKDKNIKDIKEERACSTYATAKDETSNSGGGSQDIPWWMWIIQHLYPCFVSLFKGGRKK